MPTDDTSFPTALPEGWSEEQARSAIELARALRDLDIEHRMIRQRFAESVGLPTTDFDAVSVLAQAGAPMKPTDLGTQLALSSGSVTALVDRLERSGVVERASNPTDRRSVHVALTPHGEHIRDWVYTQYLGAVAAVLRSDSELLAAEFARQVSLTADVIRRVSMDLPSFPDE